MNKLLLLVTWTKNEGIYWSVRNPNDFWLKFVQLFYWKIWGTGYKYFFSILKIFNEFLFWKHPDKNPMVVLAFLKNQLTNRVFFTVCFVFMKVILGTGFQFNHWLFDMHFILFIFKQRLKGLNLVFNNDEKMHTTVALKHFCWYIEIIEFQQVIQASISYTPWFFSPGI